MSAALQILPAAELELELMRRLRSGLLSLPVLPHVAEAALRLASDPGTPIAELAALVDTDPPIAARFLSLVNSVAYWNGRATSSTQSAILRLGLANTRDLLFQVVYGASAAGLQRYRSEVERSFRRSVACAFAARATAATLQIDTDFDYMIGLLHDIGEGGVYHVLEGLPPSSDGAEALTGLVQRQHAHVGAEIARAWKLPAEIVEACAAHHESPCGAAPHVRLAMLSDAVADLVYPPEAAVSSERLAGLGIDEERAAAIVQATRSALGRSGAAQ